MDKIPQLDSHVVLDLAADLHEDWQKNYRRENPNASSRMKTFKDDGEQTVDLLNTDYKNLPAHWQKENLEAARAAVAIVEKRLKGNSEDNNPQALVYDTKWIQEAAEEVHKKWSQRNSWDPKSKIDYVNLPQDEKDKDILHIHLAIQHLR